MIGQNMVNRLYECEVVDPEGETIGSVKRIWLDGRTGDPAWASVYTGMCGPRETFVPLQRAELDQDTVRVPVGKEQVKDAPTIDADGDQVSDEQQQTLYRYYGVGPVGFPGCAIQQPGSVQRSGAGTLWAGTRLVRHVAGEDPRTLGTPRAEFSDAGPGRVPRQSRWSQGQGLREVP